MLLRNVLQVRHVRRSQNVFQTRAFTNELFLKFSNSSLVKFSMEHLIGLHEALHLPWWSEIVLVTLGFRALVTLPLMINQKKIFQRYELLGPEIEEIGKKLKQKHLSEAYVFGRSVKLMNRLYRKDVSNEMNRLILRDNCHPIKAGMLPFFQIPLWFTLSHSYRNLAFLRPNPNDTSAQVAYQQLQQEGTLWFSNLTIPDPTGILPIATGLMNLATIQLYVNERRRNGVKDTTLMKFFTNGGRLISVIMIPIGLTLPADMTLYWLTSACWGVAQNLAFQNDKFKNLIGFTDSLQIQKLRQKQEEEEKETKLKEKKS